MEMRRYDPFMTVATSKGMSPCYSQSMKPTLMKPLIGMRRLVPFMTVTFRKGLSPSYSQSMKLILMEPLKGMRSLVPFMTVTIRKGCHLDLTILEVRRLGSFLTATFCKGMKTCFPKLTNLTLMKPLMGMRRLGPTSS